MGDTVVSAVIAAAGLSSRMHGFKPLIDLGGETIISRTIRSLRLAGTGRIVVVTGFHASLLAGHLAPLDVTLCINERYADTQMFDSLRLGMSALDPSCEKVFLLPGDMPLIDPATLRLLVQKKEPAVRPVYRGKGGHPLMIDASLIPAIKAYTGGGGLRGALDALHVPLTDLTVDDRGCILDADTPEDLQELYHYARHLSGSRGDHADSP